MIITIRGREYQVESKPCDDERIVYYITGKRGHRWYTMRNQHYPYMLFLVPEKGTSKTMDGVWFIEKNGTIEVAND